MRSYLAVALVCLLVTFGCGGDSGVSGDPVSGGQAGAGGNAGSGGDSGAGGEAGEAGSGGAGGSAGSPGNGGDAGSGGGAMMGARPICGADSEIGEPGTCDEPTPFVFGKLSEGTTRGAPSSVVGSSCGNGGISPEAVFSFVADQDGSVCLSTERSVYDTVLFVREAVCGDAQAEVACNDTDREFTGGDQSAVEFEVTSGVEYFVIVDGFGSIGQFLLSGSYGTCAEVRPETCNNNCPCGDGLECDGGRCIRPCESDTNCPDPRSVCRDNICTAVDCRVDAHCGSDGFCVENTCLECRTEADCGGDDICIDGRCYGCLEDSDCASGVCEGNECVDCRDNTQCEVTPETPFCGANNCVECVEDAQCPQDAETNQPYCLDYACVECRLDTDCDDGLACFNSTCVERARNVTCEAPNSYEVGKVILGDLAGWTGSYGGSCTTNSDDRPETVFELEAQQSGEICVSLRDSDFDSLMYIREAPADCDSGAPGTSTCQSYCEAENGEVLNDQCNDYRFNTTDVNVCCSDDARAITGSNNAAISLQITEGKRYYIFVDRYGSQSGNNGTAFKLASSYGSCEDQIPPACDDSGDCAPGLECLLNFCTVSCDSAGDATCPDRLQYCEADVCQPFDCLVESDCTFSETCLVGDTPSLNRCVDCVGDGDCFGSDVCVSNECEECATDSHCFASSAFSREFYCIENSCAACVTDDHCAVGFCGVNNTCVQCTDDAMCGDDAVCVSEVCVECRVADDCEAGFGCGSDGRCLSCAEDTDCEAGFVCDGGVGLCVQCTENSDCAMGFACFNQLCVDSATAGSCEQPTDYQIGTVLTGDTSVGTSVHQASNSMTDDCSGTDGAGPEFVFQFTPTQSGFVCFSTDGSSYDTVLHVRGPICDDVNAQLACDDDGGESVRSSLAVEVTANEIYHLFVDGYATSSQGNFVVASSYSPDGTCGPAPQCDSDDDCVGESVCTNGVCESVCSSTVGCPFGSLCLDANQQEVSADSDTTGSCTSIECTADIHCGSGSCLDFQCVECLSDDQCQIDELCSMNNTCDRTFICHDQVVGSGVACTDGAECGAQETCNAQSVCERSFACDTALNDDGNPTIPCLAHETCEVTGENGETIGQCVFQAACRSQEICLFDEDATAGDPGTCTTVECLNNDDCGFFDPACVNYTCEECAVDEDCDAGDSCVDNACIFQPECGLEGLDPCPEGQECFSGSCLIPAGTCSEPEPITEGVFMGSTVGQPAVNTGGDSCGFGNGNGPEAVFEYTPTMSGSICVDTLQSSYDTVLYIRQGVCDMQSAEIVCNDDDETGDFSTRSALSFSAQVDTSYYIFVDSFSSAGGTFVLNIQPCP